MIQQDVQIAVDAVCPNFGVSFGRLDDKSTWRIVFKGEATDEQKKAAQSAIDAFDLSAPKKQQARLSDGDLAAVLVAKGILTEDEVSAKEDVGGTRVEPTVSP